MTLEVEEEIDEILEDDIEEAYEDHDSNYLD